MNRNESVAAHALMKDILTGVIASIFVVTVAAAQTEPSRQAPSDGVARDSAKSPPYATMRAATSAARRHLERALENDDGVVRWPALRAARNLREPWIAEFALPYCQSPNLTERVLALELVTNTNPVKGTAQFLTALDAGERSVRLRGLLGMAAVGDAGTVPRIVEIMETDPDPDLRAEAARTLGAIDDQSSIPSLYEATGSRFRPVREQALRSLLALGDEGIGSFLLIQLENDRDPGVEEILSLLAMIPDSSLIVPIAAYLEHEDHRVRIAAATAIIAIRGRTGSANP